MAVATRTQLVEDVRRLGLAAGDLVMVHASLRAVGPVVGGPDVVHQAVVDAVSPGGAMMMYVGSPPGYDDVGRGHLTAEEEALLLDELPTFSADHTRANREHGALAEFFRSFPGTRCSANVGARMAAHGDRAAWLVAEHPMNYGYGESSPMAKLVADGGRVLLLGSSHDEVTLLHYAEDVARFEGKRVVRYRTPVSIDGRREIREFEEFDTSGGLHPAWPDDLFAQIVDGFIREQHGTTRCRTGKVGKADSVLMDAASLVATAVAHMERLARDWSFQSEWRQ